eukprot:3905179-Prymnesium_polylepis.1
MMPRGPRGVAAHDRAARSRCKIALLDVYFGPGRCGSAGGGRGAVIWSEGRRGARPLCRACGARA